MTSSLVFEPTSGHRGLATWTHKQQPAQRAADSAPKPGWSERLGPGMAPARGTSGDRVEGTGSRKEAECEWGPCTNSTGVGESRGRGSPSPPLSFGLKMGEARRGSQPVRQRQHRRGSCWKGTFRPHPTSTGWEALWGAQPCGVSKPLGLPLHLKFEHRLGTLLCPKGVEPGEGGGGAAWGQGCPIQERGWGAGLGGGKVGGVGHTSNGCCLWDSRTSGAAHRTWGGEGLPCRHFRLCPEVEAGCVGPAQRGLLLRGQPRTRGGLTVRSAVTPF